jgi:hypothetical protein
MMSSTCVATRIVSPSLSFLLHMVPSYPAFWKPWLSSQLDHVMCRQLPECALLATWAADAPLRHLRPLCGAEGLQDLIDHVCLFNMSWRRRDVNGLPILWQLGLDETLRKINTHSLPFHGRSHGHAASHSRQVRYRAESVCEVALIFRHVLPLHDEAHLEPQFVLSCRVSFDLVMETGRDDPLTHGQFASLDLFQAAAPKQACHLVALLFLPDRSQSLVAHRRAVVFRVGLSQVYLGQTVDRLARSFVSRVFLQIRFRHHCPSYLQVLVTTRILVEILLLRC